MTNITGRPGDRLRALIRSARKDPERWNKPRGLTQRELALMIGLSQVWVRQIECGYVQSAPAGTLASICYRLRIDVAYVRELGFTDVADAVDAMMMLDQVLPTTEGHLRATPGLTDDQRELLVVAARALRREEPLGGDIWRSRA
jgi:transcriptional regulator with XRE-family HTH domain